MMPDETGLQIKELTLLKLTLTIVESYNSDTGKEWIIKASTPVSFVELTVQKEEIAQQAYAQLGQRLLETLESELEELKGDMES